jgi:HAD superfamily hydrolase (TIGR01549 family)
MAQPRPKAVTLDLAGTLIFPQPSVGKVYARCAARLGFSCDAAALDARFAPAFRAAPREAEPAAFWAEVVERCFGREIPRSALPALQAACWEAFARPESWRLARGATVALAQLRFLGLRVGFLSNADARLEGVIRSKGLLLDGDGLWLSAGKPAPEPFLTVAKSWRIDPRELVHVGDDPSEDAAGARAVGARAVLLGDRPSDLPRDVAGLSRITGLPELVREWMIGAGKPLDRRGRRMVSELRGLPEDRSAAPRGSKTVDAAVEEAVRRLGIDRPIPEHAISASWPRLLPPALARRTSPLRILPDGRLQVHCESAVVRSEAAFHIRPLASKVRGLPGCSHVTGVVLTLRG